jgi:dephospho-CoA kinase
MKTAPPFSATRPFVLAITGGIGSGKTAVADQLGAAGARVVDTDAIAHALTTPQGAAMPALRAAFGVGVVAADGALDRAAMRALVFGDAAARAQLEGILHPMIRAEVAAALAQVTAPYAVLVVPLLVETQVYLPLVNRVLVVDCPEAIQQARVMARNGWSLAQTQQVMATQASRQARLACADDVIDNAGGFAALVLQVQDKHRYYLALSRGELP